MVDITILSCFITGVCSIVVAAFSFFKWYLPWRKERLKNRYCLGLNELQELNGLLVSLVEDYGFKSAILISGHNEGGLPRVGHRYTLSALFWRTVNIVYSGFIKAFREVPASTVCLDLMVKLLNQNEVVLVADELEDSFLKSLALSIECKVLYCHYITILDNSALFLCLCSEHEQKDEAQHAKVQLLIQKVRAQFTDGIFLNNRHHHYKD